MHEKRAGNGPFPYIRQVAHMLALFFVPFTNRLTIAADSPVMFLQRL